MGTRSSQAMRTRDFRLLAGFMALLFLVGGGSRADVASLVVIRPVAVLLAVWWGVRLTGAQISAHRWFFGFAAATFALALLHLAPLPPSLWSAAPGHELIARIDAGTGLGALWRPLTIAPGAATNALWSLFVPLAAGLGMIHLDASGRRAMLTVVLALAGLALALSLIQALAPSASFLWFYRITNSGSPVGLFANRNHDAVFLAAMIPLVTAWAAGLNAGRFVALKRAAAVAGVLLAVIVILVGGSRAGVIVLAVALIGSAFLLPWAGKPTRSGQGGSRLRRLATPRVAALAAAAVIIPVGLLVIGAKLGDAGAVGRLTESGTGDFRPEIWRTTLSLVPHYLPLGSGLGSFVEAYLVGEPPRQVMAQYINHAHNDFLEVALTLGIPGLALIAAFLFFLARRALAVWRMGPAPGAHVRTARAASLSLAILIAASVVDYPLRVPSLAAALVVLVFLLTLPDYGARSRR